MRKKSLFRASEYPAFPKAGMNEARIAAFPPKAEPFPEGKPRPSTGGEASLICWLILIFSLAFFLRFWQLGNNPPGLTWDEAAWGYNAYSLGLTGKDEFGRFLPLNYLESFGDFKPPVYAYLTVLPVKLFGLNEFATRFASAFFGTLTVLLVYYLVNELFINGFVSPRRCAAGATPPSRCLTLPLIASFLLAISPWHIMLSRAAFEANVASFFIIAGVTAFLRGVRDKSWWLILAAASFALSLQTFNTARIVSPLLVLLLLIGFRKKLWPIKKWLLLAFLTGLVILAPAISFYLTPQAKLRFKEVNVFSDASVVELANQEMENDRAWLAPLPRFIRGLGWSRLIHNRRWGYFRLFLHHYFDHFNPYFLFFKGDGNPKFSTQDVGLFYLWELAALAGGLLLLLKRKEGYWWIIPFWLLIGIIPAATARETPHALRIETTIPTWQIFTAIGVVEFLKFLEKQKKLVSYALRVTGCGLLLINFVYFQHGYWCHYPAEFSGEWQYPYKPALDYIKKVQADYDRIWFPDVLGRPYIYFLFYLRYNPEQFRQTAQISRDTYGFVNVLSFDKYHFFSLGQAPFEVGSLYFKKPEEVPDKAYKLALFRLLNGEETLVAYERRNGEIQ